MNGRAHDTQTAIGALALGTVVYATTRDTPLTISAVGGHLFGGWWCSPDVDLPQSKVTQRWAVLSGFWWPFTLLGHRSWLTHTPVLSGIVRLAYVGWSMLFIAYLWPDLRSALQSIDMQCTAMACIAFLLAGEVHIIADRISDRGKQRARVEESREPQPRVASYDRAAWAERPARAQANYARTRQRRAK